jgi:hypothetical protein
VRIGRVLFAFLLFLMSGQAATHAALGIAPRCLAEKSSEDEVKFADAGAPTLSLQSAAFDAEDRDYIIRTIAFEAAEEPDEGKAAVAYVILNRQRVGRWGHTVKEVVTHPGQFEPWMTKRSEMEELPQEDRRYQDAARVADAVLAGNTPDPTAGATHFLNPTVVRERRGGTLPDWASGEGQPIGNHLFYILDERGPDLEIALPASVVEDAQRLAGRDGEVPGSKEHGKCEALASLG